MDNGAGKLTDWQHKQEVAPELIDFYRRLLIIQSTVPPREVSSSQDMSRRLDQGQPLLQFDELNPDWSEVGAVFTQVVSLFGQYPQLFGQIPQDLSNVGLAQLREAARAWFEGTTLPPTMLANSDSVAVLETILQETVRPFLASYAKALLSHVNQERWRHGYCPVCGGNPDFAYLDKEPGARWLVCCRCDAEWLFQRLECPYCGNQDQNTLAYFTDDEGRYRLYVCERCRQYLKAIDLRQAKDRAIISLERIFTLGIDTQAQERGYSSARCKQ